MSTEKNDKRDVSVQKVAEKERFHWSADLIHYLTFWCSFRFKQLYRLNSDFLNVLKIVGKMSQVLSDRRPGGRRADVWWRWPQGDLHRGAGRQLLHSEDAASYRLEGMWIVVVIPWSLSRVYDLWCRKASSLLLFLTVLDFSWFFPTFGSNSYKLTLWGK